MDAILLKVWGWKAGQKQQVVGTLCGERLREQGHDLWQPLAVPQWEGPVHRRREEVEAIRAGMALVDDSRLQILKCGKENYKAEMMKDRATRKKLLWPRL